MGLSQIIIPINFNLGMWQALAIGLFAIVIGLSYVYFLTYVLDIKTKQPELDVLRASRKKPFPPVIALVDGAGKIMFFNGVKDKSSDVSFRKKDFGLMIDPAILTKKPRSHLIDGTPIYFYGTDTYFPVDPLGARAVVSLIKQARRDYPVFGDIKDDVVIMELLQKEGDDLLKDCEKVLKRFRLNEEITYVDNETQETTQRPKVIATELSCAIEDLKSELKERKIDTGWFSINEGLERIPLGTVSGDFKRAIQLSEVAAQNDMGDFEKKWMAVAIVFAVIVGVMVVAYMIIEAVG